MRQSSWSCHEAKGEQTEPGGGESLHCLAGVIVCAKLYKDSLVKLLTNHTQDTPLFLLFLVFPVRFQSKQPWYRSSFRLTMRQQIIPVSISESILVPEVHLPGTLQAKLSSQIVSPKCRYCTLRPKVDHGMRRPFVGKRNDMNTIHGLYTVCILIVERNMVVA